MKKLKDRPSDGKLYVSARDFQALKEGLDRSPEREISIKWSWLIDLGYWPDSFKSHHTEIIIDWAATRASQLLEVAFKPRVDLTEPKDGRRAAESTAEIAGRGQASLRRAQPETE